MSDGPPTSAAEDLTLTVEAMAYGGKGIARLAGKVYFIADATPGDVVRARVVSDNGRYGEAEMTAMVTPSPLRAPPRCPVASACGGCQWMGIDYAVQLEWKRTFVASSLARIGKLENAAEVKIIPSPQLYEYRNRILLRLRVAEDGALTTGYFRRGSRDLVPIARCDIAAPALNRALAALHATSWRGLGPLKARCELQEVPAEGGRDVTLVIYPGEGERAAMDGVVERCRALPMVRWAGLVFALESAPPMPFDEDLGIKFASRPGQFQQVNVEHNRTLRRLVHSYAAAMQPARVLDVFCGSGNLSLPLADGQRYVEGVEVNKHAIDLARHAAASNGLTNVTFLAGDAEKHLWKCSRGGEQFDLVILDPPREGMFKGMVPLKNLAPRHIIYVSCDPTTLARDLGYLCRNGSYELTDVTALDFFPNTYHVETVAVLRRRQ